MVLFRKELPKMTFGIQRLGALLTIALVSIALAEYLGWPGQPWAPRRASVRLPNAPRQALAGCASASHSRAPCSFEAASEHFACHGTYPQAGRFANGSTAWEPAPGFAACGWDRSTADPISCLVPPGTTANGTAAAGGAPAAFVLLLGDSLAYHYSNAFAAKLQAAGASCQRLKHEATYDGSYFGLPDTVAGRVDCKGCNSFLMRCTTAKTHAVVDVEYVRMEVRRTT